MDIATRALAHLPPTLPRSAFRHLFPIKYACNMPTHTTLSTNAAYLHKKKKNGKISRKVDENA